jgi:hypothetical protein
MKNSKQGPPTNPSGDPADSHDVLTRIALGETPESAAVEIGVPLSVVQEWLRESSAQVEIGEIRASLVQSLAANGASIVSAALEVLGDALSSGTWDDNSNMAAKLVMSSGVMGRVFADATNQIETRLRLREHVNRLAFLDKLKAMGLSEEEWNYMMRPVPTGSAPRGRRRKK